MQSSFLQSLMKHNIPLPADQESRKLDWLLSINEEFFQQQLKEVVSTSQSYFPFMILHCLPLCNSFHIYFFVLQGFSAQELTPGEAAKVLCRCEARLGHRIPEEDLKSGNLAKWLSAEDYSHNVDQVSESYSYLSPNIFNL